MPNLTYPGPPYPFSAGDTVTASGLQSLLYSGSSPASSLAILNGLLDEDNLLGDNIAREHTQKDSAIASSQVAGTLSLDFFDDLWGDNVTSSFSGAEPEAKVIPGAARDFYMPWAGYALVRWTVFWTNTSDTNAERSYVFLTADGSYVTNHHRAVGRTRNAAANPPVHEGYKCSRVWSGHYMASLAAGWHSVAMNVVGDDAVQQTRFWARNMIVTRVKYP